MNYIYHSRHTQKINSIKTTVYSNRYLQAKKMNPDIEIICPNCKSMANFYAVGTTGEYVIKPSHIGKMSCAKCGMNKKIEITTEMYFYQIPVDNRILYARTFDNLLILRKYFAENIKMNSDPELDFPKSFYKNRKEIIELIDKRIKPAGNKGNRCTSL